MKGMQQGLITSGLNHAMHEATSGWDQDPPSKESSSSNGLWDKIVSAWADFTGGSEATRVHSEAMALSRSSTGGVDWAGYGAYTLMMEKASNPGNLEMGRGLFGRTSVGSKLRISSINDILRNPEILTGRSLKEIQKAIGGTKGWEVTGMFKTRSLDKGVGY